MGCAAKQKERNKPFPSRKRLQTSFRSPMLCESETAVAEPSSSCLDWTLTSLCMAVGECYFQREIEDHSVIIGFACVTCNHLHIDWQDYLLDPDFVFASCNEYHEGDCSIAVYLEI